MTQHVLMVAAENDALPGTKVGGVGDVLRDLPKALKRKGCEVNCVLPSYGFLARLPSTEHLADVPVEFMGDEHVLQLMKIKLAANQAEIYIFHHELFSRWGETVYCHDGKDRPFASDATKFAFFLSSDSGGAGTRSLAKP
jgi:starch synthase